MVGLNRLETTEVCGIAGILNHRPDRPAGEEMSRMLRIMLDAMVHRGPDDEGMLVNDTIALGHRRLSIIDLSEAGRQPISHDEADVHAIVNGEIYNYRPLMDDLKAQGCRFRSACDSEIALHAFVSKGCEMLRDFNGMWGMAIWDGKAGELFLCRDRLGVKPLYTCSVNGYFLFASEMKALLPFLPRPLRVNRLYLAKLLRGHFDDCTETPYADIRPFPAASFGVIRPGGELRIERYWELPHPETPEQIPSAQAETQFRELFTSAVDLRMISDAPLTYFISGGIDSTAVVGTAAELAGPGQAAIASTYRDPGKDERRYINDAVRHSNLKPTIISPEPNGTLLDELKQIVRSLDGPSTAQGNYLQWHLFRTVRHELNCKVVLSGNGGDEVLGGYHPYFRPYLNSLMRDYHATGHGSYLLRFLLDALIIRRMLGRTYFFSYPVRSFPPGKRRALMKLYRKWLAGSRRGSITNIANDLSLNPDFISEFEEDTNRRPHAEFIEQQTAQGLTRTILPALLRFEDRMSMAWSVECRQPFLDYRVVEFATKLDYRLKTRGVMNKRLVRRALADRLPRSVRWRVNKMGLPTPLARWLRTSERDSCVEYLQGAAVRHGDFLDPKGVDETINAHLDESIDASKQLYVLLTTALWLDQTVEASQEKSFWNATEISVTSTPTTP